MREVQVNDKEEFLRILKEVKENKEPVKVLSENPFELLASFFHEFTFERFTISTSTSHLKVTLFLDSEPMYLLVTPFSLRSLEEGQKQYSF